MPAVVLPALGALGGALLLGSVDFDQAVYARAEVAAGVAPRAPGEDAEPALSAELRPGAALRLRTVRSTFALRLEPRLYYRTPNVANLDRPLVLVRSEANHSYAMSPRLVWRSNVGASYGEVDYLDFDVTFGQTAPTRELQDPVITRLSLDGRTGFAWQGHRLYELSIDAVTAYQIEIDPSERGPADPPVGEEPTAGSDGLLFPETLMVGLDVVQEWDLDARSTLRLPVSPRYFRVDPGAVRCRDPEMEPCEPGNTEEVATHQVATSVELIYRRLLDPRTSLEAGAGVTVVAEDDDPVSFLPRGSAAYEHVLSEASRRSSVVRLRASLETPFDPVLGELRPLATIEATHERELDRDWAVTFLLQAATVTTASPLAEGTGESTAAATAMANYRIAPWLLLDFGTRLSTRGSHLAADEFELTDTQVWGFCGLTAVLASSLGDSDWAL